MSHFNRFFRTLLSSSLSIIPIVAIVLILSIPFNGTQIIPLKGNDYPLILIGAIVLLFGLAIFSLGASRGLSKVGEHLGASLSKQNNIFIIVIVTFVLGTLITCAEPSIMILSTQTPLPGWMLVMFISIGVGLFVAVGVIRVIKQSKLNIWLLCLYGLVFALCILVDREGQLMPLVWDAGGATTGSATVPFLLSLGAGVAAVRGGKNATENSFGLVAISSIGPLLSMAILAIIVSVNGGQNMPYTSTIIDLHSDVSIYSRFINELFPTVDAGGNIGNYGTILEVTLALLPIMLVFFIYQSIFIKLPAKEIVRILFGFLFSFIGLVLFLTGVKAAMMPLGDYVGQSIGQYGPWAVILICFMFGLVTIVCEPATHVLTKQVEDVSSGGISKKTVLITLSIGVGVAIALAAIRSYFNINIVYFIVPGYLIALALTFFCPSLYTAIAFDSGGVASGPMTVSFILPMIIGMTLKVDSSANIMARSFGVIAFVAMTPLICLQILGIYINIKKQIALTRYKQSILLHSDNEIIRF